MSATVVHVFASYLYGLKYIALTLAVLMLISGLDDLLIDIAYWTRRMFRYVVFYRRRGYMEYDALYTKEEQPLAIMVPAWQETNVIKLSAAPASRAQPADFVTA